MEDSGSGSVGFRFDIKQTLLEAQHRWLRPAEICEILRNYQKFQITPEPPYKPVSGSVFLFDRKALRYFRKDGHNWRKKKDGKTVKEAHEKLKVGSVDMLHCYYAHGEDNENFQRRSYWMLEQDLMHIVFVHYLEVKGNKTYASFNRSAEPMVSDSKIGSSLSFSFPENNNKLALPSMDSTSPTSTLTSAYEDAESEDQQASSGFQSEDSWVLGNLNNSPQSHHHRRPYSDGCYADSGFTCDTQKTSDMASWEEVLGHGTAGEIANKQECASPTSIQANWAYPLGDSLLLMPKEPVSENLISGLSYNNGTSFFPETLQSIMDSLYACPEVQEEHASGNLQKEHSHTENGYYTNQKSDSSMKNIGSGNYSRMLKQSFIGGSQVEEGLNKVDSFSRWMAKELGEGDELAIPSTSEITWSVIDTGNMDDDTCIPHQLQLDAITVNPSLSRDQLFSIIDFCPNWAYSNCETEVLITGTFLKSKQDAANCRWSCMFGEVEVPAEVLADGVLRCRAPQHRTGLVPFYITCSNRLACSEVREFEYQLGSNEDIDCTKTSANGTNELHLRGRLEMLLSHQAVGSNFSFENVGDGKEVVNKIIAMMEEENCHIVMLKPELDIIGAEVMGEQRYEEHLKGMFYSWLLLKVTEDGKGAAVLDEEGQGMLHLAAALGYKWVLQPTIVSGVSIDFRDVNGWTALHWAAFCGREEMVAALVSLGASPGALTDPSTEFPLGQTPADLASANGHKGISGFLAESSLTTHLLSLTVNDLKDDSILATSAENAIQTVSERVPIPTAEDETPDVLSLKDSLAAVCNATQAAARIHQIFRIQSFQRKQFIVQGNGDLSSPDEQDLSFIAAKTCRLGQGGTAHTAAICIQKKYRGWKKRKDFLLIRQRIVKIQAHVRGYQVRKKYRSITWSVGILEKVILRWRRKGSGLRGFRKDTVMKDSIIQEMPTIEDNYDVLKGGRKQTEERLEKALARVKSMAQNPEGRAQYRRLLTVAEDFREPKDNMIDRGSEDMIYCEEELFDVRALLYDDDTFMSVAFE